MKEYLWFVGTDTGYVGTDQYDILLHEATDSSDDDLMDCVWIMALEQAQSYGIERYCGQCEACEEGEYDDCEQQEEGIEGYSVFYSPREHDCKRSGGGSFLTEYPEAKFDEELQAYYIED